MLNKNSHIPAYVQIRNHYTTLIQSKQLSPNEKLPTEQEIANKWSVSKMTVRQGLQQLIKEEMLYTKRGVGIFVKMDHLELDTLHFTSFSKLGKGKITTKLIGLFKQELNEDFIIKNKIEKQEFWYIERLRLLENQPAMFEISYLPTSIFSHITKEDMLYSKYEYVTKHCEQKISHSSRVFVPISTDRKISELLGVPLHTSIIKTESLGYLQDGRIFEYTKLYHHPEHCIIKGVLPYKTKD